MRTWSPHKHFFSLLPVIIRGLFICIRGADIDVLRNLPSVTRWTSPWYSLSARMHTEVPICKRWSLYAYRDPCLHTGIVIYKIPECLQGSRSITVCIRESQWSLYAYGVDSVTNRMHIGNISKCKITTWIPVCKFIYTGIVIRIWKSPYAYGQGIIIKLRMGIPIGIWSCAHMVINIYLSIGVGNMACKWIRISLKSWMVSCWVLVPKQNCTCRCFKLHVSVSQYFLY